MVAIPDWYWFAFGAVSVFAALQYLWQERRGGRSSENLWERLARSAWAVGMIAVGAAAPPPPVGARVLLVLGGCLMLATLATTLRQRPPRPE